MVKTEEEEDRKKKESKELCLRVSYAIAIHDHNKMKRRQIRTGRWQGHERKRVDLPSFG